jgi:hypothetical protein
LIAAVRIATTSWVLPPQNGNAGPAHDLKSLRPPSCTGRDVRQAGITPWPGARKYGKLVVIDHAMCRGKELEGEINAPRSAR